MSIIQSAIFPKHLFAAIRRDKTVMRSSPLLVECAVLAPGAACDRLSSRPDGLTEEEARQRLAAHGPNVLAKDQRTGIPKLLLHAVINPLVVLLAVLATISFVTGDPRAGIVMALMIVLGVTLKLVQEAKADRAAAALKAMISVTATVVRTGTAREAPIAQLVPGDIVKLAAGDMIPADVRILSAKDLFVLQGALTGESFPVEKYDTEKNSAAAATMSPIELLSVAYLGTSVESGSATALVVATGGETFLGGMARSLTVQPSPTAFDKGVKSFTWLMIRFMAVMVPLVLVINGLSKHNWSEAFLFAMAVAVGLTPEMLPMIVTVCLSKGAIAMSRRKVIVKRINAIQNLGAMDVLCTDKTGTLTMDHVILERHCDVALKEDDGVLALAYLNSYFQTGLKNVLDRAVLDHKEVHEHAHIPEFEKVDEIPFDFQRRIMSVVVRTPEGKDRIISKGAPEAIFPLCANFELEGQLYPMDHLLIDALKEEYENLSADGFRVLAIASKDVPARDCKPVTGTPYGKADETGLILSGYVAFLDPPKETATAAIAALKSIGIAVKVVTGDNDLVARKICKEVGLATESVLLGADVEKLSDDQLVGAAEKATLFARVSPAHKQRVIKALQAGGHAVGYMGDGINDAPALRAADVGISVDTAVDIAKESADMILLEKSLMVLEEGVVEGRKVFANIVKYVRMGASSNFGNMFSVLGASIFIPFLPMAPIQILANNLLYDISQTAIPTDDVDPDQISRPRPWNIGQLTRFILFVGPCSSIFDYTTFLIMLLVFKCGDLALAAPHHLAARFTDTAEPDHTYAAALFQSGWFVESLLTQTLIIHIIRTNRIPFLQSRCSWMLGVVTTGVALVGVALPYTPVGAYLGFVPLPGLYWPLMVLTLACYVVLTQVVKTWLLNRKWI
jgi:Mg2+-importing ATPase